MLQVVIAGRCRISSSWQIHQDTLSPAQRIPCSLLLWSVSCSQEEVVHQGAQGGDLQQSGSKQEVERSESQRDQGISRKIWESCRGSLPALWFFQRGIGKQLSKCLYIFKFSLLQHQISSISQRTKKKINTMASFILYNVNIKYSFQSPSLSTAASNDLQIIY